MAEERDHHTSKVVLGPGHAGLQFAQASTGFGANDLGACCIADERGARDSEPLRLLANGSSRIGVEAHRRGVKRRPTGRHRRFGLRTESPVRTAAL